MALEELKSLEQFLFEIPLYATYKLPEDLEILKKLYRRGGEKPVDGYCPSCGRQSSFDVLGTFVPAGDAWNNIKTRYAHDEVTINCVREKTHMHVYYFIIRKMTVQKIGQFPSLADIANDEVAAYRREMEKLDAHEFHKAVGLAAHGVGVGSFVYLRRVFERLIEKRYAEFKAAEGWNDEEFKNLRMSEKIKFLKGHLPPFLVENAKIYSILSIGVHELDESACLSYFEVMKQSIVIILEEDKKKREELRLRDSFKKAIAAFDPSKISTADG